MATILKETWFIPVMAVVGAIVLILIIVIAILCCIWNKNRRKEDEESDHRASINNNVQGKNNPPSNDLSNAQNWVLVYPSDKVSAPASSNSTARVIRGNEPVVAGSSMIHMDKELRGGVHTQTSNKPKSLEKYNDGFDHNGDLGYGSEVSSSPRISQTAEEIVESHARRPRIQNVSVSSIKKNESHMVYYSDKNTTEGSLDKNVGYSQVVNAPYRIPQADYDNSPAIVMYISAEHSTWQSPNANDHAHNTKVKGIASAFEHPKENSPLSSPTRTAVENELKELQHTAPIKKRLSQRTSVNHIVVQKKLSNPLEEIPDDEDPDAWRRNTGKNTIETRLKRYKKAGAMSVFPD